MKWLALGLVSGLLGCASGDVARRDEPAPQLVAEAARTPEATSLLGQPLFSRELAPERRATLEADLAAARANLTAQPDDELAWIWVGRRLAYLGRYRAAIAHYTEALEHFPDSYRLRRHRGHRYLTVREFEHAIADLTDAMVLASTHENELEPDGAPNAAGIPISSTHGNIHYHLGLAHYWRDELEAAQLAFETAASFALNDDAVCSSHWWLYVAQRARRLTGASQMTLENINADMNVIENHAYHRLLRLAGGALSLSELEPTEAERYGLSLWHHVQGAAGAATDLWVELTESPEHRWESFGTISAEAHLSRQR